MHNQHTLNRIGNLKVECAKSPIFKDYIDRGIVQNYHIYNHKVLGLMKKTCIFGDNIM